MASYFQSYFRTSSMPKRLLQYALSRLEILDTEALGLDNLDIALGKNSEFVFRDVGLKLRKLEALLQLPPSFEFSKAKVLLLRITIPVDIYSSPILVEVDGVECQLRVPGGKTSGPTSPTNHDRNRRRPASNKLSTDQSHTRVHHGRRRSDFVDDEDELDSAIPTAADLAQSFLQTEPKAEKAELEAAIISETQDLASSVSSDDGEEIPVGTGTALSLPAFMTNFLQGVVDRLQVKVRGISLNLDVDIPNESGQASPSHATDPVTVQIKIDNVDIEGVTHEAKDSERVESKPAAKHGKRLIFLSKIRGVLITEANVFSSLARSSAFSSPVTTHSEIFNDRKSSSRYSSVRESTHKSLDESISPEQTSVSSSSQLSSGSRPPTNDSNQMQASVIASDSGRFDDASDDGVDSDSDGVPPADLLVSAMAESIYDNSAYLDQITQSQYADDDESIEGSQSLLRFGKEVPTGLGLRASPMSTPRASTPLVPRREGSSNDFASRQSNQLNNGSMPYSVALPRRERPRFSEQRVSQSQPTLPADLLSSTGSFSRSRQEVHLIPGSISRGDATSDDGSEASTPLGEDLAESQLFSHEDAESMYLSAISHGSSPGARVPGGWAGSDHGDDTVEPGPASPLSPEAADEPLDNLEHARHISPLENSSEFHDTEESVSHASQSSQQSRILSSSVPAPAASPNTPALPQNPSNVSERSATSSEDFTRMTKQIFSLDQIAIYIPGTNTPTEIISESPDLAYGSGYGSTMFAPNDEHNGSSYSVAPGIPGAFSVHEARKPPPPKATIPPPKVVNPPPTSPYDPSIEVTLGQLLTQFDISVGRLIWRLVCKIQEALKQMPATPSQTISDESSAPDKHFKIRAEQISVKFLERLQGASSSPVPTLTSEQWSNPPEADILLQTTFKGLEITSDLSEALTKTTLTLQKFSFAYAQEDIVSFNADLQMRASVRDLAASAGVDLSVNIYQTSDTTRCEISTLPLHVSIDLQRLDETFSWFGGLSSVLNMGSSMVSNATITSASPSPSKPKPRGVRFEAPIKPDDKSLAAQNKIDARIGGFILDLVGKDCSIGVETSSVKIVSRDEGIGVSIQKIRLSGPHLRLSNNDPAIVTEIIATRIEFLPTPKDVDLDRLLSLITPSKAKYDQHDDILLDTLLRQRKQGAVLRLTVDDFKTRIGHLDELNYLPELGEEISRLSTVAKYLPDDDRPGLLSLITVRRFNTQVDVGQSVGSLQLASTDIEIAQISLPALVALSISTVSAHRNGTEELLGAATDPELREPRARAPAIMARMIGDEMEPIVKIKLWNLKVEYRVPTLIAILGLAESATAEDLSASLSASVATLTGLARQQNPVLQKHIPTAVDHESGKKPMTIDVVLRDCIVGLNPLGLPSQVLLVLTESHIAAVLPKDQNSNATVEIGKASILVIDNVAHLASGNHSGRPRRESFDGGSSQVADLCSTGFVSVGYMSSAKAIIHVASNNGDQSIDVELRDDLFVLESCADSTQTLIATLNGLTPPTPPSKETKYRTKVIPVKDLLASLSGDAFGTAEGEYDFDDDFGLGPVPEEGTEEDVGDLEFDSHYIKDGSGLEDYDEARSESEYGDESLASVQLTSRDTHDGVLLESFAEEEEELENEPLDFQENHFGSGSVLEGTAHQWNSAKNTYDKSNAFKVRKSPFKVCVRDVHVIWNLFDGYDWQHTRDTITRAVQDVESKAIEKRSRSERRPQFEQDFDEEETVIGDFLFNSIYIGIPANRDPRELAAAINQGLNDDATETESVATTTFSSSPSRQGGSRRVKPKKLRLNRSKHHKITFELRGVCVDLVTFPPGSGETQSSIDVRVHDFEIFDHIPTSTWRKFATYMHDAGERETGASQIHIEILNVKPIPELAASEIVLKATVLPLRLHVDQDALDFITRFFEFKDDSVTKDAGPGDVPFLQRVEVNSVQVKLDFKPKRVDYAGLRSGHTTEFMNFLILDEADMVLRHTIIYGISGFDKMGKCLNDIWMPDIKRNQLPGILAGLAPVRSLVNVGGGLQQLVVVPLHEYKKDGRVVRSISKGAAAFAKTTGTELVKLGAKVAIGMQTVLQGAEGFLGQGEGEHHSQTGFETDEPEEESKQISLYANQPVGVFQGLRGGYAGLQRDLLIARDAIIAVPGEVMEEGTAAGVLRAVRKHAPTVILRPAIGVAKAGGQILMGATNSMDPANLKKAGDKYKSH